MIFFILFYFFAQSCIFIHSAIFFFVGKESIKTLQLNFHSTYPLSSALNAQPQITMADYNSPVSHVFTLTLFCFPLSYLLCNNSVAIGILFGYYY